MYVNAVYKPQMFTFQKLHLDTKDNEQQKPTALIGN
jgi:hypothetical protein